MSGRFTELSTGVNKIVELLLADEDLCKLLYYTSSTPLTQIPLPDPTVLLFENIYPYMKIPEIQEKQKSIVGVVLTNANLTDTNKKFKEYLIIFNIICHVDLWKIKGSLRPYEIAERIDTIFNERRENVLSMGKILMEDFLYREFNNKFTGYYLTYKCTSIN
jgi:hypothetical protein